ncbi:GntR family transcriptional regulator [Paenibacillus sp. J2TS4]|uniref:GntR family transcriptional regulator n=1 Tax=Paenibacillus sp. J2TS4 TaxID=2807194 RepID=UPI001B0F562C|nr:GntR family transcriptional regulator [Paenibacillus sp. J2TS4]GIP32657.1 GntR family transcriptional regulator [Paenibacillus sp. J2TS4]
MLNFYELKLNNKEPVYIQTAMYVKRQILLKRAVSGDKLPSRREIAAQLNINPNTVQKAFKLMEEEGYVHTSGNQGSVIFVDEAILTRIEEELTQEMVKEFIDSAKEINLSFKKVVDLISELWEQD